MCFQQSFLLDLDLLGVKIIGFNMGFFILLILADFEAKDSQRKSGKCPIESTQQIVNAVESGMLLNVRASIKLSRNWLSPLRTVIVVLRCAVVLA